MSIQKIIEEKKGEFDKEFLTETSNMTRSGKRLICDPDFAKSFIFNDIIPAVIEAAIKEVEKFDIKYGMRGEPVKDPLVNLSYAKYEIIKSLSETLQAIKK